MRATSHNADGGYAAVLAPVAVTRLLEPVGCEDASGRGLHPGRANQKFLGRGSCGNLGCLSSLSASMTWSEQVRFYRDGLGLGDARHHWHGIRVRGGRLLRPSVRPEVGRFGHARVCLHDAARPGPTERH